MPKNIFYFMEIPVNKGNYGKWVWDKKNKFGFVKITVLYLHRNKKQ